MRKAMALIVVIIFATMGLMLPVDGVEAGEAKQKLERLLVGQWKVPKNRYKNKISFEFTKDRKFECVHTDNKKEPVNWSGNWKVRTTSSGAVKAYLKARNQADPEKYMQAVISSDPAIENLTISIKFDFKGADKSGWDSKLILSSDEEAEDEEASDEDAEDEDAEDEDAEDEDAEDEEETDKE